MNVVVNLVILLCFCYVQEGSTAVTWRMEPLDVIAFQGESVTLDCIASGTNSSRADRRFYWHKLSDINRLSRNNILLSSNLTDRLSVFLDKPNKRYSLTIHNVTARDRGQFQCILQDGIDIDEVHSGIATLTVIVPPEKGYTPCKHYNGSRMLLTPSQTVTIRCSSMLEEYVPNPTPMRSMHNSWIDLDRIVDAYYLQNGTVLLKETKFNRNEQMCATNSKTLFAPETCMLTTELPKLPVLVYPSHKVVNVGDDVTFQCVIVQSVKIMEYRWYIEGPLLPTSILITNNSQSLQISNLQGATGDYKVKCQVTDKWALSVNATAIVRMNRPPEKIIASSLSSATRKLSTPTSAKTLTTQGAENILKSVDDGKVSKIPEHIDMKHVSILIGPTLACVLLFVFIMVILWFHSTLKKERQSKVIQDTKDVEISKNAVQLRSRRYSDSAINRQSVLYETDYENIEATGRHRSLFIDNVFRNGMRGGPSIIQPLHANLKVKIEMPNLAAALSQSDPNLHSVESCFFQSRDSVCSAVTDTTFVKAETIIETDNETFIDISELAEEDIPPPLPAPRKPSVEVCNNTPPNKDHYYVNLGRQARLQRIPPVPPPRSCNNNLVSGLPFRQSNTDILNPEQINTLSD